MSSTDEQWVCGLLGLLQSKLDKAVGDQVQVNCTDLCYLMSALTSSLPLWRDAARINYLDAKGADWAVRMGGVEMGRGRLRHAMDIAILRCEWIKNDR